MFTPLPSFFHTSAHIFVCLLLSFLTHASETSWICNFRTLILIIIIFFLQPSLKPENFFFLFQFSFYFLFLPNSLFLSLSLFLFLIIYFISFYFLFFIFSFFSFFFFLMFWCIAKDKKLPKIFAVRKDTCGIECLFAHSEKMLRKLDSR